jgi:hypothetical protein
MIQRQPAISSGVIKVSKREIERKEHPLWKIEEGFKALNVQAENLKSRASKEETEAPR